VVRWPLTALAAILTGCSVAPLPLPPATHTLVDVLRAPGLSYSYPRGWYVARWNGPSRFTFMVGAVSNQRLRNPCFRHGAVGGCGQPLGRLQPGTMLVEWWENGDPQWRLADQPGAPLAVDGRPARMEQGASALPACLVLGAGGAILVVVAGSQAPGNYFQFTACMRGPGLGRQRTLALALLNSARFGAN
jgi:hypothetical protein